MIKFQKIRYKNLLSSGNYWTEIDLLKNNSTLIIGQNGAGKSTLLDALTFVLFNKPFRKITKGQLVNTTNEKDCVVEIDFLINSDQYKIVRGIKPNIFKIQKNNKILDELASSVDQQKWLEQNLLKLNYKSFTQIVILGSSNFVPFMQLSSQHRREVVEDLLDIKVFSSMNDITKGNIKTFREEIRELEYKKENCKDKIEVQENFIKELQKRNSEDVEHKTDKQNLIEIETNNLKVSNDNYLIEIKKLQEELEEVSNSSNKLKKLDGLKIKLLQKISNYTEDHKFFDDNTVCPTCTQSIENEFRLNKMDDIQNKKNELTSACEDLENTIQDEQKNESKFIEISKRITKLNNEINSNNVKIFELEKQYKELQHEIQKLITKGTETNIEHEKLKNLNISLDEIITEISLKKEELLNYEFIHLLLKDGGAKTNIIKKYLPIINKNLNKYLELLDFCINFNLDEEFNEKALNPIYEDFSYDSFSEGEKMRIDLALLFTWREVAKVKNSVNTNLLILDEVFDSSLDDFGTDNFTKIIRYVINKSNVFVISHKTDELIDKFDSVVKFQKQKGFGVMVDS
jgi:DNA repair exonuclease SbcCD ATPase subunit